MPKFVLKFEEEPLKTFDISEPVVTIGRLPENTISIVNMGVSRRHARIEVDRDGSFVINDLNSLNGTFVNEKKVSRSSLVPGDQISIGKYTIVFEGALTEEDSSRIDPISRGGPDISETDTFDLDSQQRPTSETPTVEAENDGSGTPLLIETDKHVVYRLEKPSITLGNSEEDDIFIDGLFIDQSHVNVEKRDDGVWLVNKKLLGKVKVNGKKTKEHRLQHKDRLEIGSSTLRFMENG